VQQRRTEIRHVYVLLAGVLVKYRGCYHLSAPALWGPDTAEMQVWRWAGQYKASLLDGEAPLPEMLRLGEWLSAHIPLNDSDPAVTRISHGDYRSACSQPLAPTGLCFRRWQYACYVVANHCQANTEVLTAATARNILTCFLAVVNAAAASCQRLCYDACSCWQACYGKQRPPCAGWTTW